MSVGAGKFLSMCVLHLGLRGERLYLLVRMCVE